MGGSCRWHLCSRNTTRRGLATTSTQVNALPCRTASSARANTHHKKETLCLKKSIAVGGNKVGSGCALDCALMTSPKSTSQRLATEKSTSRSTWTRGASRTSTATRTPLALTPGSQASSRRQHPHPHPRQHQHPHQHQPTICRSRGWYDEQATNHYTSTDRSRYRVADSVIHRRHVHGLFGDRKNQREPQPRAAACAALF